MKKISIIITLILLQLTVWAQQNREESIRINQLLESARTSLYDKNYSSTLYIATKALKRASIIEEEQLIWEAQNLIGEVYLSQKKYEAAVYLFLDLSLHAEKNENFSVSANGYFSLANTYSALGAFSKATKTYQKAKGQFEKIDYELGMIEIALTAGYNHVRAHEFKQAERQFKTLLKLAIKDSIRYFEFEAYDALIELYTETDQPQTGLEYGNTYYNIIKDQGDAAKIADLAFHMSLFHEQLNDKTNSQKFLSVAIKQNPVKTSQYRSKKVQFKWPEKLAQKDIIEAEQTANDYENEALIKIETNDEVLFKKEAQKLKGVKNQENEQLTDLEHHILLGGKPLDHSALESEYAHQDLLIAHHEYENKERQAEIVRYKQEASIHKLEKDNWEKARKIAEEKKVILEQKVEIKDQQFRYYLTLIIIAAVIIIGLGFEYLRIRRLNRLLAKQQDTIHQSNLELKASNTNIRNTNKALHNTQQDLQKSFVKEKQIRKALETAHTELKNTHDSLIQAEKMSALGMLTASIAHELKNPINFISNGVELIRENTDEVFQYLKNIGEENEQLSELRSDITELIGDTKFGTTRIQEIVEGLRVYSRKDAEEFKKADITSVMNAALLILKPKYKHSTSIVKKYSDNLPEIDCFQGEINQVFINIIGNGVDAIGRKGTITIMIDSIEDKFVRVIIQDDGSGIPDDVKSKMFDRLFTTKTASEGTGLGLSITADIIKKHNGKLQLKTKLGVGTAFIITLPVNQPKS
ncbi:MAG: HAMP domain-containing histidine kinase [Reichenbachiella sp.]